MYLPGGIFVLILIGMTFNFVLKLKGNPLTKKNTGKTQAVAQTIQNVQNDPYKELRTFMKNKLKEGFSAEIIRENLIKKGWNREIIDRELLRSEDEI